MNAEKNNFTLEAKEVILSKFNSSYEAGAKENLNKVTEEFVPKEKFRRTRHQSNAFKSAIDV